MKKNELTERLYAIARLAEQGERIVDVGTDHGRIPIWLAKRGCYENITATDLRSGPLGRAMRAAREEGVYDRIRFYRCDGLDYSGACASDTVIIAGMGGETMISILSRASWTKRGVRLFLQPQSKIDELYSWLSLEGYHIDDAMLVEDTGRLYIILSVTGAAEPGTSRFIEDILLENHDQLLPRWVNDRLHVLTRAAAGMTLAKEEINTDNIRQTLARLTRTKEKTDTW